MPAAKIVAVALIRVLGLRTRLRTMPILLARILNFPQWAKEL